MHNIVSVRFFKGGGGAGGGDDTEWVQTIGIQTLQ